MASGVGGGGPFQRTVPGPGKSSDPGRSSVPSTGLPASPKMPPVRISPTSNYRSRGGVGGAGLGAIVAIIFIIANPYALTFLAFTYIAYSAAFTSLGAGLGYGIGSYFDYGAEKFANQANQLKELELTKNIQSNQDQIGKLERKIEELQTQNQNESGNAQAQIQELQDQIQELKIQNVILNYQLIEREADQKFKEVIDTCKTHLKTVQDHIKNDSKLDLKEFQKNLENLKINLAKDREILENRLNEVNKKYIPLFNGENSPDIAEAKEAAQESVDKLKLSEAVGTDGGSGASKSAAGGSSGGESLVESVKALEEALNSSQNFESVVKILEDILRLAKQDAQQILLDKLNKDTKAKEAALKAEEERLAKEAARKAEEERLAKEAAEAAKKAEAEAALKAEEERLAAEAKAAKAAAAKNEYESITTQANEATSEIQKATAKIQKATEAKTATLSTKA
jgi:hypothetical protein